MRALITSTHGPVLRELRDPCVDGRTDVKVRIALGALCRTDLYVANGKLPVPDGRILGHEAVGWVVDVGDGVGQVAVGDRVVVNPLRHCGKCVACLSLQWHHCHHSQFMSIDYPGAFAEFIVVPEHELMKIPAQLSFEIAVYAEPVAATRAMLAVLPPGNLPIHVAGEGRIGLLTQRLLEQAGYSLAPAEMGRFPIVVEAAESVDKMQQAFDAVEPGGLLIVKSRHPAMLEIPLLEATRKRITMATAYYAAFEESFAYLCKDSQFIGGLLGNCWPLAKHTEAFAEAYSSEALKTLIAFD